MHFESVTLTNFRCFGPRPQKINFDPAQTALIGANGSGKTALMCALLRLFGVTSEQRRVRRQDFHVPLDEDERPKQRTLSIDAVFQFLELSGDDDDEGDEDDDDEGDDEDDDDDDDEKDDDVIGRAVPAFFEKMGTDDNGVLKFRLRLEATWTDDGTDDGTIEECVMAVQTLAANFDRETECQTVTAFDRARIQVVYIPANRDPHSHVTSFLRGRLWRAISWSTKLRQNHQESGQQLNEAFADQAAVKRIESALTDRWRALHTGGMDATPSLRPVDLRFERFIRRVEVAFHPDENGRERDLEELSDGQRSLFQLALTAATLDVEATLAADVTGFDADAFTLPALTILAIEEPENNLAPFFLSRIMRQVQGLTKSAAVQAVISSHSASVLGRVDPQQVRHFHLLESQRNASVHEISLPKDAEDAAKYVREAVRSYPELYFARFVVLGEGASEEVVLPQLAEAMGFAIDRSFVAVVPLGGRHVNHLWKLLADLEIPSATLLDIDCGRSAGGWGRIKTAFTQLLALGIKKNAIVPNGWAGDFQKTLDALDTDDEEKEQQKWLKALERHGVFFCWPLDLDLSMLCAFPAEYRKLEAGMRGPRATADVAKRAVLGPDGDPDMYENDWDEHFRWYQYLFLGRGKPSTHIRVLSQLSREKLAKGAPKELRDLIEYVTTKLKLTRDP